GQGIPVFPDPLAVEDWVAMIAAYCGNGPERSRQMERMRAYRPCRWNDHFAALTPWLDTLAAQHNRAAA
ncbi:MAG: hypothetical protein WA948_09890, partial [Pontixanthobacter sp.]